MNAKKQALPFIATQTGTGIGTMNIITGAPIPTSTATPINNNKWLTNSTSVSVNTLVVNFIPKLEMTK